MLDRLERRQLAAELLPLHEMGTSQLEHRLDHPDVLGGQGDPPQDRQLGEECVGLVPAGDDVGRGSVEVEPGLAPGEVEHFELGA